MTIWISRELPLFNCERLYMWCARIGHPSLKKLPFEFLKSFRCSILGVSVYYVPESDLRMNIYDHLNCSIAFTVQFRASRYIIRLNRTSCEKLWPFEILECFRCSILSVSIIYVLESDIRVKCYDHSSLLRASVVQFRTPRYIMSLNQTSVWRDMIIRISRELPLFNFERRGELCPRIGHPVKSYDHSKFSSASVVQFWASR